MTLVFDSVNKDMKSIIDQSNNIILIAENAKEQNLINNIPDVGILYRGPVKNPQSGKTDFVLTLQPGERIPEPTETTAFAPIEIIDETVVERLERILNLLEDEIHSRKSSTTKNKTVIKDPDFDAVVKG